MATKLTTTLNQSTAQLKFDELKAFLDDIPDLVITDVSSSEFKVHWGSSRKMKVSLSSSTLEFNMYKVDGATLIATYKGSISLGSYSPEVQAYYDTGSILVNIGREVQTSFVGFQFIKDVDGDGRVYTCWNSGSSALAPRHIVGNLRRDDADLDAIWAGWGEDATLSDGKSVFVPTFIIYVDSPKVTTKAVKDHYNVSFLPTDIKASACTEFTADGVMYIAIVNNCVWKI